MNGMTLQNSCGSKEEANKILTGYRVIGFTGRIVKSNGSNYLVYIGSFGARYKKLKNGRR